MVYHVYMACYYFYYLFIYLFILIHHSTLELRRKKKFDTCPPGIEPGPKDSKSDMLTILPLKHHTVEPR